MRLSANSGLFGVMLQKFTFRDFSIIRRSLFGWISQIIITAPYYSLHQSGQRSVFIGQLFPTPAHTPSAAAGLRWKTASARAATCSASVTRSPQLRAAVDAAAGDEGGEKSVSSCLSSALSTGRASSGAASKKKIWLLLKWNDRRRATPEVMERRRDPAPPPPTAGH